MIDKIKNKHLLIDGDIYKYRCAAAAEKTKYLVEKVTDFKVEYKSLDTHKEAKEFLGDEWGYIWSRKELEPVENALQICKSSLETLFDKLQPSKVSIFLSPDRCFRDDLARTKTYKGNRTAQKPTHLKAVGEYLVKSHGATVAAGIEADDAIGIGLTSDPGTVCVSIDKDLDQVPGWHFNWVEDRAYWITPKEGDYSFYTQLLTGDTTDNVPGVAGIGPAKASGILDGAKSRIELCERVWAVYRAGAKDSESAKVYFLEQARLLWILRHPFDHTGKQWWVPPIQLV